MFHNNKEVKWVEEWTSVEAAEEWNERYQRLDRAAQESATALSAEMKLQAMALYDEVCAFRRQLME